MSKPKFEIVLADADETIFDFKKSEYVAFKSTLNLFGKDSTDDEFKAYSDINARLWKELEKGTVTRDELKTKRFDEWFSLMGFSLDSVSFNKTYAQNLGKCCFLIDGAEDFIKKLSSICDVYIITNGLVVSQSGRFDKSSVKPYIKKLYISEAIGYTKPDVKFFDYCIKDIGEPDKSKYIVLGDSISSDMLGGRNAGLTTCRFSRDGKISGSPLCDYEITDYNSFFKILF